jgi:hypothetical protein
MLRVIGEKTSLVKLRQFLVKGEGDIQNKVSPKIANEEFC